MNVLLTIQMVGLCPIRFTAVSRGYFYRSLIRILNHLSLLRTFQYSAYLHCSLKIGNACILANLPQKRRIFSF